MSLSAYLKKDRNYSGWTYQNVRIELSSSCGVQKGNGTSMEQGLRW